MITLESTIMPKSIAPRLIRLAVTPGGEHDVGREQHRQRDRQRHDQAAPDVAQQDQQDHDDQRPALDQVVQDRVEGLVDQVGPVVERLDRHARRQALLELGDLRP